uniref:Uncharacterized protein n=1 Tax=viral metagenome TaxID=1070528 RepID=A0A6H1Z9J8_9ZZZZ
MALTDAEKARVREYLGYLSFASASSIQLGFPAATQPLFLLEQAMAGVLSAAEDVIRRLLYHLDDIEAQLSTARSRLRASKIDELTLNAGEIDALWKEQYRWACRLADALGAPINAYAERFRGVAGGGMNLRVIHDV